MKAHVELFCSWPKWGKEVVKRMEEEFAARNSLWILQDYFTGRDRI